MTRVWPDDFTPEEQQRREAVTAKLKLIRQHTTRLLSARRQPK